MDLLLTLDYELCGNGAGDVMRDVICPTNRILNICDSHGAKMTIMFEVGEYWAFQKYESQLRENLGYSPSELMRGQVVDAIRRGHDVQLHLHPQWINAQYAQGVWRLSNSCWRLADLPDGLGDRDCLTSITGALTVGKQTLEGIIEPVAEDYQCVCFRAGGFYAQPSQNVISAMKRAGLRADSSVVKGYKVRAPFAVDYSHVKTGRTAWWTTDTELTMEGNPGENIMELSVSSQMEPYWMHFRKTKLRSVLMYWRIENGSRRNHTIDTNVSSLPGCRRLLGKMLRKHPSLFDFCTLSSKSMLGRIEEHARWPEEPVVIIGHSKDFVNDRELDRFLALLGRNEIVNCQTIFEHVQRAVSVLDLA